MNITSDPRRRQQTVVNRHLPNKFIIDFRRVRHHTLTELAKQNREYKNYVYFPLQLLELIHEMKSDDIEAVERASNIFQYEIDNLDDEEIKAFEYVIKKISDENPFIFDHLDQNYYFAPYQFFKEMLPEMAQDRISTIQATKFKSETVVPFYLSRLREFIDVGFQLDPKHLKKCERILMTCDVEVDLHNNGRRIGGYRANSTNITLVDLEEPEKDKIGPLAYVIIHEMSHLLSGHSNANELNQFSIGLRRLPNTGNEKDDYNIENFLRGLNEAFTESLTSWINSEKTPDFNDMSVREFFLGSNNLNGLYPHERTFFIEMMGEMKIDTMTKAYFEDSELTADLTINTPVFQQLLIEMESESLLTTRNAAKTDISALANIFTIWMNTTQKEKTVDTEVLNMPAQLTFKRYLSESGLGLVS